MAKSSQYSTTIRTKKTDAVLARCAAGVLKIFSGSMPADGDTNPAGTLLATFTLPSPAGVSASGVLTFTAPANVTIAATGTAAVAQLLESDGTTKIANFNVGATGGGFCLELGSTAFQQGAYASITSFTWTEPATGA
jgi:hypothetical protein